MLPIGQARKDRTYKFSKLALLVRMQTSEVSVQQKLTQMRETQSQSKGYKHKNNDNTQQTTTTEHQNPSKYQTKNKTQQESHLSILCDERDIDGL